MMSESPEAQELAVVCLQIGTPSHLNKVAIQGKQTWVNDTEAAHSVVLAAGSAEINIVWKTEGQ